MHIPNKFTVIRIFLVFNQCRIRSDTRRADRRLSTLVIAMLTAVSPPACSALAVKLTVLDYARKQGGPG
jgi:hypothetical protein